MSNKNHHGSSGHHGGHHGGFHNPLDLNHDGKVDVKGIYLFYFLIKYIKFIIYYYLKMLLL